MRRLRNTLVDLLDEWGTVLAARGYYCTISSRISFTSRGLRTTVQPDRFPYKAFSFVPSDEAPRVYDPGAFVVVSLNSPQLALSIMDYDAQHRSTYP